jgi:hypothetical protein
VSPYRRPAALGLTREQAQTDILIKQVLREAPVEDDIALMVAIHQQHSG